MSGDLNSDFLVNRAHPTAIELLQYPPVGGDSGILITLSYKIRIASPGSMQDPGCLGLVHWDDPEGWYGTETAHPRAYVPLQEKPPQWKACVP